MEYREMAKYYDKFYSKKDYKKEVKFLLNFINKDNYVLDIGCGTGIHGNLLEKNGIKVDGLDLNKEMLEIAKTRIHGNLYNQNILNIDIDKKYNIIISMFAVLNHLENTKELSEALENIINLLLPGGKIIIDLHNPRESGEKTDRFNNIKRTMKWHYDKNTRIENSEILFQIDNVIYRDTHKFRIFSIDEVKTSCDKLGLKILGVHENYNIDIIGTSTSKNLQFIIEK